MHPGCLPAWARRFDVLAAVLGLFAYIGGGVGLVAAAARLVGHRGRPGGGCAVQF